MIVLLTFGGEPINDEVAFDLIKTLKVTLNGGLEKGCSYRAALRLGRRRRMERSPRFRLSTGEGDGLPRSCLLAGACCSGFLAERPRHVSKKARGFAGDRVQTSVWSSRGRRPPTNSWVAFSDFDLLIANSTLLTILFYFSIFIIIYFNLSVLFLFLGK